MVLNEEEFNIHEGDLLNIFLILILFGLPLPTIPFLLIVNMVRKWSLLLICFWRIPQWILLTNLLHLLSQVGSQYEERDLCDKGKGLLVGASVHQSPLLRRLAGRHNLPQVVAENGSPIKLKCWGLTLAMETLSSRCGDPGLTRLKNVLFNGADEPFLSLERLSLLML